MHTFSALSFLGDQADIHRPCAVVRDHGACHILVDNTLSIQAVETAISSWLLVLSTSSAVKQQSPREKSRRLWDPVAQDIFPKIS